MREDSEVDSARDVQCDSSEVDLARDVQCETFQRSVRHDSVPDIRCAYMKESMSELFGAKNQCEYSVESCKCDSALCIRAWFTIARCEYMDFLINTSECCECEDGIQFAHDSIIMYLARRHNVIQESWRGKQVHYSI